MRENTQKSSTNSDINVQFPFFQAPTMSRCLKIAFRDKNARYKPLETKYTLVESKPCFILARGGYKPINGRQLGGPSGRIHSCNQPLLGGNLAALLKQIVTCLHGKQFLPNWEPIFANLTPDPPGLTISKHRVLSNK